MMNVKVVEKNKSLYKLYMENLSRNDLVGHTLAVLTSGGGILLMLKIALV